MTIHDNFNKNDHKNNVQTSEDIKETDVRDFTASKLIGTDYSYTHEILWKRAISFLLLHVFGVWGLFIVLTGGANHKTIAWTCLLVYLSIEGVTVGAHRLFTHKSFKATPALRAILIVLYTLSGQNSLFWWCRDHRLHHRYADTDADPHNSKRGMFFSHVGWLMVKRHPKAIELGLKIDVTDIKSDWMIMFQRKYYFYLHFLIAFMIPVGVPYYFFGETLKNAVLISYFTHYMLELNPIFFVNSLGHRFGPRPYDKNLLPTEHWFASTLSLGECWHNYHHTFPWDYKGGEPKLFNPSAIFIRFFERIGMAYDLKSVSSETVSNRMIKTGDGTQHFKNGNAKHRVAASGLLAPQNPFDNTVHEMPNKELEHHGLPANPEDTVMCSK